MAEKHEEDDREIVYYYSRERRLEKAPRPVRALYDESGQPSKFRRLAGNKGNIFLMLSVFMVCIMLIFSSRIRGPDTIKLGENNIGISIEKKGDRLFLLVLEKTVPKNGDPYTGRVDIGVSPVRQKKTPENMDEAPPLDYAQGTFYFTLSEKEDYSLWLPFGGDEFYVILETEEERLLRRIRPKK